MNPFVFNTTSQLVFRPGASAGIGDLLGPRFGGRILFVTDSGLRKLGLCDAALASLSGSGMEVTVFDAVEADPSLVTVEAAIAAARLAGVTGVIGFGGGSSLDVAKVVALICGSGEDIDGAWGVGNAKGPRLPLALVPTTAGTGSEVTPVSIITVGGDEKRGVSWPVILPDVAILDADLTIGLPPSITAATGIDAMVHAIEAYASRNANNNPLSRMLARQALQLLGANIEKAVFDGKDRAARGAMLLGSMLAGQAFDVTAKRVQLKQDQVTQNQYAATWEVTVKNGKSRAVDVRASLSRALRASQARKSPWRKSASAARPGGPPVCSARKA